ncbi:MAG: FAD-dependent oxidoreductase [Micropruina sp.]|nr:FAD-dependent oxidoreductase [Micropruina sp.]
MASGIPYDTLVLATGAVPEPIDASLRAAAGERAVHRLHTLDDLRGLLAALPESRTAAVLGAGPLGIGGACALRMRGLAVTLVEREASVLPGLLDGESARVVQATLDDLGVCVHTSSASPIPEADLVVACTGITPRVGLALEAGLPVDGGILVNDYLISIADPRIAAIGDCARPESGVQGLVEPGWDQARRLAQLLAGMPADEVPALKARHIVRLHTPGLDVAVMGERPRADGSPGSDPGRVISLLDPQARRALRLVVRLGRLVGATAVGAPGAAPDLIVAHRNQTPVPADPAQLVIKGTPFRQTFPESSSGGPFVAPVCRCNSVSAAAITEAFEAGARDVGAIATATRATTGCGAARRKCARCSTRCGPLRWPPEPESALYHPRYTSRTPAKHALPRLLPIDQEEFPHDR